MLCQLSYSRTTNRGPVRRAESDRFTPRTGLPGAPPPRRKRGSRNDRSAKTPGQGAQRGRGHALRAGIPWSHRDGSGWSAACRYGARRRGSCPGRRNGREASLVWRFLSGETSCGCCLRMRAVAGWWSGEDSNLRRRKPAGLQPAAFGRFATTPRRWFASPRLAQPPLREPPRSAVPSADGDRSPSMSIGPGEPPESPSGHGQPGAGEGT